MVVRLDWMWLGCFLILMAAGGVGVAKAGIITDTYGNTGWGNGTMTWGTGPMGIAYKTVNTYSDDGLGLLFAFTRSFINTVQPNDFPFSLIKDVLNNNFDIGERYMELVNYAMGFGICFVLGLLYVIFMPVCGCCFCCCRCCGNCGGDLKQVYDENEGCKRMGFAQALFLISVCLFASAACVYSTNDRFTKALDYADITIADNLDDLNSYINNSASELTYIALDMYDIVSRSIISDIGDLGPLVYNSIRSTLDITTVIDTIIALDTTLNSISTNMAQVISDITALQSAANTLESSMNTLASDITTTKSSCSSDCVPTTACDSFSTSGLTVDADFSTLPDLTSTQSAVDAVVAQNLTGIANSASSALDGIAVTVNSSTVTVRDSLQTTMDTFKSTLNTMIDDLMSNLDTEFGTDKIKADMKTLFTTAKDYDLYRVYFGYGLMGVFSLIPLMFLIGILCGCACLGENVRPTERGCIPSCGGCLMMIGTALIFLLSGFLMLLTTLSFMIGGNLEKICQTMIDLTIFKDFLDSGALSSFNMGEMLLSNASITISMYGLLIGCRANKAPFKLLQLDAILPLDTALNYSQYLGDIDSQLNDMANNVDLSNYKVLTTDMQNSLNDFKNSGIDSIDFATMNSTLAQSITSVDFTSTISAMTAIKSQCTGTSQSRWQTHISTTTTIRDVDLPAVESAKSTLQTSLSALENSIGGVTAQIDNVLATAAAADDQIQNNVTSVLTSAAVAFKNQMLSYVDCYILKVRDMVYNDLAKCLPLWTLYESMTTMLCSYTVDALNGFWFGLGWGLMFAIPAVVIAVRTSKYYRKMNEDEGYDDDVKPENEDIDYFEVRYNAMKKYNQRRVAPDYYD
ncbi:prominin-1-A-like [Ylistrum balloti]|uniref:prominin-1-A-like n=1 Tax=Ylistrum balloti TaxID=509963 RepID=UPI0029059313|nr:prominin-1-A-like [Ylistrum balloti]